MSLRLALFGQAPLAIACLERLQKAGHIISVVYTPEAGSRTDALASYARSLGLDVIQCKYIQHKDGSPIPDIVNTYQRYEVDLNVLASFTSFLPSVISDSPQHKSICYHPSLLPKYRGGNALQWQIINGEIETGVSIFVPDSGIDTGPIVIQKGGVQIASSDTVGSLFFDKLAPLGVEAIIEAVSAIDEGTASIKDQNESLASFQKLVDKNDAMIDLSMSATDIDRLIRGCDPQPGAHLPYAGKLLKLYDTSLLSPSDQVPGTIISMNDSSIVIALNNSSLRIGKVRFDNGKEPAKKFAERHSLNVCSTLISK